MPDYPTDRAGLEVLPFDECLRLLASVHPWSSTSAVAATTAT